MHSVEFKFLQERLRTVVMSTWNKHWINDDTITCSMCIIRDINHVQHKLLSFLLPLQHGMLWRINKNKSIFTVIHIIKFGWLCMTHSGHHHAIGNHTFLKSPATTTRIFPVATNNLNRMCSKFCIPAVVILGETFKTIFCKYTSFFYFCT